MSMVLIKCPTCRYPNASDLERCFSCRVSFGHVTPTTPTEDEPSRNLARTWAIVRPVAQQRKAATSLRRLFVSQLSPA